VLPPPPPIAGRSEQLERIAQQADRQTRRGFELASRGAYFAARSEFIKALRLLAQGLDTEHQTDLHSRSLAAGLTAIGEAADFIPTGSRLEADLNLPAIIEGHRTPVLKSANTQGLTPLSALKCYFTFAQEQLAVAAGSEVAGSMALHALGKLHAALARQSGGSVRVAESKAVAFYQAALLVYPKNLMAANDLGVLLARCGNYHEAATALKYGLSIDAQSTSWHNLAAVYGQLGQTALARQANQLSQAARQAEIDRRRARQAPSREVVRWVDPGAFNQFSGQERVKDGWLGSSEARPQMPDPRGLGAARPRQPPAAAGGKPPNTVEPHQPAQPAGKSVLGWRPWGVQEERR
jgi:tetratricopeptide (TPR) repeat protein